MKYPISWHKDNLRNFNASLAAKRNELARITARLEDDIFRMQQESDFRTAQIEKAIRDGKTEFDPDKFYKKAKP